MGVYSKIAQQRMMAINKINVSKLDASYLYDPLHTTLSRALAFLALIQADDADINHGFTFDHKIIMDALWGLEAQIKQAMMLLDAGEKV